MGKKILAVVGALVAAQLLSGCFALQQFNWSDGKVKAGDNVTGDITLIGNGAPGDEKSYFWVYLDRALIDDGTTIKKVRFDSKKTLAKKPVKMVEDPALAAAYEEVGCQFAPTLEGTLYRTKKRVSSATRKLPHATFKLKTSDESIGYIGFVTTGDWLDDGDKVPEDPDTTDDEISCTGSTTTFLPAVGGGPVMPRSGTSVMDAIESALAGE